MSIELSTMLPVCEAYDFICFCNKNKIEITNTCGVGMHKIVYVLVDNEQMIKCNDYIDKLC